MAHLIRLPVELQFQAEPAVWHTATAFPSSWFFAMYSSDVPMFKVLEPVQFRGLEQSVLAEHLAENLRTRIEAVVRDESRPEEAERDWRKRERRILKRLKKRMPEEFANDVIRVLICERPKHLLDSYEAYRRIDPWPMRDEFLRARTLAHLAAFLNKYGAFGTGMEPRADVGGEYGRITWKPHIVLPGEVRKHQEAIKSGLKSGAAKWFEHVDFELYSRPDFPHFVHTLYDIQSSLYATVTIDFLRGVKFRSCARTDCGLLFKLESRHKRRYCGQYCAHLESVRRTRRKHRRARTSPGRIRSTLGRAHGESSATV